MLASSSGTQVHDRCDPLMRRLDHNELGLLLAHARCEYTILCLLLLSVLASPLVERLKAAAALQPDGV